MSFFKFNGNISPEDYKKTLESVASLQDEYKDRIDDQAGINTKTTRGFIGSRKYLDRLLKDKDDNTALDTELKSYNEIVKILTQSSFLEKTTYLFVDNPDLLPKRPDDATLDFEFFGQGGELALLGQDQLQIGVEQNDELSVTDATANFVFPPPLQPKKKSNKLYRYKSDGSPDCVDLKKSYRHVFDNLLLFDLDILEHFELLEGADISDLEAYIELITFANQGQLPNNPKVQKVQALIQQGPVPKKVAKETSGKLPRKPTEIQQDLKKLQGKSKRYGNGMAIDPSGGQIDEATAPSLPRASPLGGIVDRRKTHGQDPATAPAWPGASPLDEFEEPSSKASGMKKSKRGLSANSSYIIQGGKFGDLDVDVPALFNKLHLKVKKGGDILIDEACDRDTLDILTHRLKPNKMYSKKAQKMLTKMINHSNYPLHPYSQKLKIAQERTSRKREKKLAKAEGRELYDPSLDRLITLTSEVGAGNFPNEAISKEIKGIAAALLKANKIDKTLYKELLEKYVSEH